MQRSFQAGGNLISLLEQRSFLDLQSAQSPYAFELHRLSADRSLTLKDFKMISIYLYTGSARFSFIDGSMEELHEDSILETRASYLCVSSLEDETWILLAGIRGESDNTPHRTVRRSEELKRVLKPWGFEVWLHTEKAPYAFKRIEMNPNFRTSLQYHERKAESNFVLKGKIKFHYQCENQGSKDQVTDTQIGKISLKPFSLVWIPPGTLHRLESLEPTTLFEVSSPEVDDVIRVQDDSRRSHGRIESEHIQ